MDAIARSKYGVITMENHTIVGGLGSIIAEQMAERGMDRKLVRIGLRDIYAHGASKNYLLKKYRMDAMALIAEVEGLVGKKFGITEDELKETFIARGAQHGEGGSAVETVRSSKCGVQG